MEGGEIGYLATGPIYACDFDAVVSKMSEEDVRQMIKLEWMYDEKNNSWTHF
ncbi:MAG: hypothetical protein HQ536_01620 [Parcubacteria group bacterium]|nr:hypothetical protein [Parcubacteria group bacterium]